MFATALVSNFGFSFDYTCAKFVRKPHKPHTLIIENIFEFINVRSWAKERLWKMLHRISQKCGKCWIFACSAKVLLNYFKISVSKLFTWPLFFFLLLNHITHHKYVRDVLEWSSAHLSHFGLCLCNSTHRNTAISYFQFTVHKTIPLKTILPMMVLE